MSEELRAALRALAESAVSAGRTYWDSYYGRDNSFHLETLEEWDEYKAVVALVEKETAK